MMSVRLCIVDAFAERPFTGNPAGVCLLERPADERWMQAVAAELRFSETAFIVRFGNRFRLRWFTPAAEVELCGHATLAAAHVLWEFEHVDRRDAIRFESLGGPLVATRTELGIALDFPALRSEPIDPPESLIAGLASVVPDAAWRSRYALIARLSSPEAVRGLSPNLQLIRELPTRSVIVTAKDDGRPYDFVSRVFAPAIGIDEDPVTGAAHCALASIWSQLLGRTELVAYQASSRSGELRLALRDERVAITGRAVTVFSGHISGWM